MDKFFSVLANFMDECKGKFTLFYSWGLGHEVTWILALANFCRRTPVRLERLPQPNWSSAAQQKKAVPVQSTACKL